MCNPNLNCFITGKVQNFTDICSVQITAICKMKFTAWIHFNIYLQCQFTYFQVLNILKIYLFHYINFPKFQKYFPKNFHFLTF